MKLCVRSDIQPLANFAVGGMLCWDTNVAKGRSFSRRNDVYVPNVQPLINHVEGDCPIDCTDVCYYLFTVSSDCNPSVT